MDRCRVKEKKFKFFFLKFSLGGPLGAWTFFKIKIPMGIFNIFLIKLFVNFEALESSVLEVKKSPKKG